MHDSEPRSTGSRALLAGHVGVVAVVAVYAALSATIYSTPDANLGLAFGAGAFIVLGVPWSLTFFLVDHAYAVGVVGTLVNLGLHLYLRRRPR